MTMDCTFHTDDGIFNYRVGAIIRKGSRFLLAYDPAAGIYYSVGGRVRMNETLEEALKREVEEESGIRDFEFRLCAIHENFFDQVHEISIFFEVLNPEVFDSVCTGHLTQDGPGGEKLVWLESEELSRPNVFPDFLSRMDFSESGGAVAHFITRKESSAGMEEENS